MTATTDDGGTHGPGDDGFTLVELLVAMAVVVVLLSVTFVAVGNTADLVGTAQRSADLNEEARRSLNRIVRDVRQTTGLVTAVNPDGPGFDPARAVALRFRADYDGDGCTGGAPATPGGTCLAYDPASPEDLTYCYDPGLQQLYVIDNQVASVQPVTASSTTCDGGQPLLAGNVAGFRIEYRSNAYRYDVAPADGVTSWPELDAASPPVGNGNGRLDVELDDLDALVLVLTVRREAAQQTYRTYVDLRNRSQ